MFEDWALRREMQKKKKKKCFLCPFNSLKPNKIVNLYQIKQQIPQLQSSNFRDLLEKKTINYQSRFIFSPSRFPWTIYPVLCLRQHHIVCSLGFSAPFFSLFLLLLFSFLTMPALTHWDKDTRKKKKKRKYDCHTGTLCLCLWPLRAEL